MEAYLSQFKAARVEGLPRFAGGLAAILGTRPFDTSSRGSTKPLRSRVRPHGSADVLLLLTEELAVFDNLAGRLSLWVYAESGDLRSGAQAPAPWPEARLRQAFDAAMARLDALVAQLKAPLCRRRLNPSYPPRFAENLARRLPQGRASAKEYIAAGDVMQVVIGQVLQKPFKARPSRSTARCAA